jgi:hypothetical protein
VTEWEQPELPFPATSGIRQRLGEMQGEVEALESEVPSAAIPCGCAGGPDCAELARTILSIKALIGAARDLEHAYEAVLVAAMPERQLVVDGLVLERKGGTIRKSWDHFMLASQVALRAAVDLETGEQFIDLKDAEKVAAEIMATAGISYWRVGELKTRGIDASKYCVEEKGRPTVVIRQGPQ